MATALDLISGAMRLFGAIGQGEDPSASEASNGLDALNELLDSWSADRLMVYTIARQLFPLVSGKQTYTAGPGGDFDMTWPQKIERCGIVVNQPSTFPLEIPIEVIDVRQWSEVSLKSLTGASSWPTLVYPESTYPLNKLNFWPIPNYSDLQVALYSWQALTQFPDLTTDFSFPPGYLKAVRYGLAVAYAPEFGTEASATVQAIAANAKYQIEVVNVPVLRLDAGGKGFVNAMARFYSDNNAGRG